jgi:signal transduction histidine kinase
MTDPALRYAEPPHAGLDPADRDVLDTVNRKIAAAASLRDVVDFLFDATRDICPCDRVSVAFVEESGRLIRSYHTAAGYEPLHLGKGYSEALEQTSLGPVIERGTPRIIDDLEAYFTRHHNSVSTRLILREGIRSSMTCPLAVEGRNVGVLFRSSRRPRAYTGREAAMHLAVAERLGQTVEKAYRIEQLEAAKSAYFEMLSFVSHELKSPVASLVTDAQLLRDGYLGEIQPEQRKKVERMIAKGQFLLGLVNDYLNLARIESGELERHTVRVADFVREVVEPALEMVQPQIDERKMRLQRHLPEAPVEAECDPRLLQIVLVNLLGNAAKYGRDEGRLQLRVVRPADELRVAVWNEGPGFPPGEMPRLFRKFSRVRTPALMAQRGTGVGLYTCLRIMQIHGGRIWGTSQEGRWAEFTFRIPQPLEGG